MITIGSRVRYVTVDTPEDLATGYYPPIGTLGTVVNMDNKGYEVKWDEGTQGDGIWWCDIEDVEEEFENE